MKDLIHLTNHFHFSIVCVGGGGGGSDYAKPVRTFYITRLRFCFFISMVPLLTLNSACVCARVCDYIPA